MRSYLASLINDTEPVNVRTMECAFNSHYVYSFDSYLEFTSAIFNRPRDMREEKCELFPIFVLRRAWMEKKRKNRVENVSSAVCILALGSRTPVGTCSINAKKYWTPNFRRCPFLKFQMLAFVNMFAQKWKANGVRAAANLPHNLKKKNMTNV